MRAVVQRVKSASVKVDGTVIGEIGKGLLVLVGIESGDTRADAEYIVKKSVNLRVFNDEFGKINKSVSEVNGGVLVVSQFTLLGDTKKGNRPSFVRAMVPEEAEPFFAEILEMYKESYGRIETGLFGADMDVALVNDGPVTILIDSRKVF